MSVPISDCLISKAAKGDEKAFEKLVRDMRCNMECGHWGQFPCSCKPPCPEPTETEMCVLNERLQAALSESG